MNINEIYEKEKKERGLGFAQWIVGRHYMNGIGVPQDNDSAEAWFLRAWKNGFPGTAYTQTFVLKAKWNSFLQRTYTEKPRLKAVLEGATLSSGDQMANIAVNVTVDTDDINR